MSNTKKVRMKAAAASPAGTLHEGREYELEASQAEAFVAGGYALPVEWPEPVIRAESEVGESDSPSEPESTSIEPPENASLKSPTRRKPKA